ncbi:phenylacetate--CoA ligase family protein [Vibrio sp. 05-20-BW147]|uniref:phenylacetate--CoA ligase family protein n=1 Tax=Vibrio sp. 05-20-BW147 TaxID=2575834 RepID=UPI001594B599|nr:phenylacetate--CoA ligase family protein [Vibrio sp. 05-20-BW147]NVC63220.1 phenylacetate--CoA ligase family protein [Vibrio sp. 05-20-BW147]
MIFRDFGWFILKDNILINFLYLIVYKIFIRKGILKSLENIDTFNFKKHPAYNDFDFDGETDKEFVVKFAKEFRENKGIAFTGYTSGTSNRPLVVYRSLLSVMLDELSLRSHWYSVGVKFNPRIATLRGDNLFKGDHKGPVFWKKMPFSSRLIMSSFHLSRENSLLYLKELERYKPDIILAYPSSVLLLARFAAEINWKPNWNLMGVFTSGESFSESAQKVVRAVFKNTYDHYGQAERVCRFQQCKEGNYHVVGWYTKTELLQDVDGFKRIVGTNYRNKAMPLYRYNTGDLIAEIDISEEPCSCGNKDFHVAKIHGRPTSQLILKNGVCISAPALSLLFYGVDNLSEAQVVQKLDKSIIVKYSTLNGSRDVQVEKELLSVFQHRLGSEIMIKIEFLDLIPRNASGKLMPLIVEK